MDRRFWVIGALLLAACEAGPGDAPPAPADEVLRGHLVWGHEARSFTGCGSSQAGWVVDRTGGDLVEVYESLAVEAYQPIFVEIRGRRDAPPTEGFGADYPEQVVVTELRRAEREGWGCRLDLEGVEFVAMGNEPSWRLEIRKSGITLSRPGQAEARFAWSDPDRDTETTTYRTQGGADRLVAVLSARRCVDPMDGSRFSHAAEIRLGESTLNGCAVAGVDDAP